MKVFVASVCLAIAAFGVVVTDANRAGWGWESSPPPPPPPPPPPQPPTQGWGWQPQPKPTYKGGNGWGRQQTGWSSGGGYYGNSRYFNSYGSTSYPGYDNYGGYGYDPQQYSRYGRYLRGGSAKGSSLAAQPQLGGLGSRIPQQPQQQRQF